MQNINNLILAMPDKLDEERDEVARAWEKHGGIVERIGKFWNPPQLGTNRVRLYGSHIFCMVLGQKYNLTLISPDDDLLVKISDKWTRRKIWISNLNNAINLSYPIFIKPVIPKLFVAKVYNNYKELCDEFRQLDNLTKVLISEIVEIQSEARTFILDGKLMSIALYEGCDELTLAEIFIQEFIKKNKELIPKTCVVDLGYIKERGWSVLEFNPTWGAGLNGCDANQVVKCIASAVK